MSILRCAKCNKRFRQRSPSRARRPKCRRCGGDLVAEGDRSPASAPTSDSDPPPFFDDSTGRLVDLESLPPASSTLLDPDRPPERLAHYEIEQTLGEGEAGMVYKAWDPRLERHVALKVLRPALADDAALIARFRADAEAISSLKHPYIVQLYDFREDDGLRYFATDHVEGQSLGQIIRGGSLKQLQDKLQLFVRVLRALGHAHRKAVMHGDFRPSNVIVADGRPHITDFGMAKALGHEAQPLYMSPEQLGGAEVDVCSEIYSAGVVFHELLCGKPPYDAREVPEAVTSGRAVSMRRLKSVPRRVREIAAKALAKDRAQRYRSADAWADDLEPLLDAPEVERVSIGERLRPRLLAGLSCVLLTTVGMGFLVADEARKTFHPVANVIEVPPDDEPATPGSGSGSAPLTQEQKLARLLDRLRERLETEERAAPEVLETLVEWCQEHPEALKDERISRRLGRFVKYPEPLTEFAMHSPEDTGWLGRLIWGEDRARRLTMAGKLIAVGKPMLAAEGEKPRRDGLRLLEAAYHLGSDRVEPRLPMARAYVASKMYQTALDSIQRYLKDGGSERSRALLLRARARHGVIATRASGRPTIEMLGPVAKDLRKAIDSMARPLKPAERQQAGQLLWPLLYRGNQGRDALTLVTELYGQNLRQMPDWSTAQAMQIYNQAVGKLVVRKGYGWRFSRYMIEGNGPIGGQNVWLFTRTQKLPLEPKSCLVLARPGATLDVQFYWPQGAQKVGLQLIGEGPKLPDKIEGPNKVRIGANRRWLTNESRLFRGGRVVSVGLDLTPALQRTGVQTVRIQLSPQAKYQVWIYEIRITETKQ